jgi:hypothetical protein
MNREIKIKVVTILNVDNRLIEISEPMSVKKVGDYIDERRDKDGVERYEYIQWTGLTDKNGVEIYFEDFVEDENGDIFIVKWNKTKIDLINISNCAIIDMKDNLIIKSNIYENEFKFSFNHTEIP